MTMNELIDKKTEKIPNEMKRGHTTLSLPLSLLQELEDIARQNKRNGKDLKTVAAIIRHCIDKYLDELNKSET